MLDFDDFEKMRQETTYHTIRLGRVDLLEEIQKPYCTGLFYMHNCTTKGAGNTGQNTIHP